MKSKSFAVVVTNRKFKLLERGIYVLVVLEVHVSLDAIYYTNILSHFLTNSSPISTPSIAKRTTPDDLSSDRREAILTFSSLPHKQQLLLAPSLDAIYNPPQPSPTFSPVIENLDVVSRTAARKSNMSSTKEATAKQPEVKRGGGGGSKATLEGVHWVAPGQKGDLEWMAKSNEYKDSLFVYPNNYRITGTQVWFTRMRPFNNAVGVDLLSSPAEEVLDTEKEAIDKAMKELTIRMTVFPSAASENHRLTAKPTVAVGCWLGEVRLRVRVRLPTICRSTTPPVGPPPIISIEPLTSPSSLATFEPDLFSPSVKVPHPPFSPFEGFEPSNLGTKNQSLTNLAIPYRLRAELNRHSKILIF
eukprot:g68675.t1